MSVIYFSVLVIGVDIKHMTETNWTFENSVYAYLLYMLSQHVISRSNISDEVVQQMKQSFKAQTETSQTINNLSEAIIIVDDHQVRFFNSNFIKLFSHLTNGILLPMHSKVNKYKKQK